MPLRITGSMMLRTALADVTRQRSRLSTTQERASSGLRINRPSDDPVGTRNALALRSRLESIDQFERNIEQAQGRLRSMETALNDAIDTLQTARERALQGANGTMDAEGRRILAEEVAALHDRLLAAANARFTGGYVFAGFRSDAPAFSASGPFVAGSPPPTVSYNGDGNEVQNDIEDLVTVPATLDGRRVFLGDANGDGVTDAGRENVFDLLETLWQELQNDSQSGVQATLDRFDRAQTQLSLEETRIGAVDARLQAARDAHADARVEAKRQLSVVEDADTVAVLSDLVNQETALQASLDSMARLVQPSLLDFLA